MSNRKPQRQPNTRQSQNRGRSNNTQVPVKKKPPNGKKPQNNKQSAGQQADTRRRNPAVNTNVNVKPNKKKPQKKKLTKQQLEAQRIKAEEKKKRAKARRAEAIKIFFNRLKAFFVLFSVFLVLSMIVFFLNLTLNITLTSKNYLYQIGADDATGMTRRNVSYDTLYVKNRIYINFSEIAEMYEFIITGDKDSLRYIMFDENGEVVNDVKFMLNTSLAYVNGVPARMESPVKFVEETMYVPMRFFTDYISGLSVQYNEYNRKLTIINDSPEGTEIWFNLQSHLPTENLQEMSLDAELLYLTDPARIAEEKRLQAEAEARAQAEARAGESAE